MSNLEKEKELVEPEMSEEYKKAIVFLQERNLHHILNQIVEDKVIGKGYCSIYRIYNTINVKLYIGQTWHKIEKRLRCHKNDRRCPKLANALDCHGDKNFFTEEIYQAKTQKEANIMEYYYICLYDAIKNGYNVEPGGHIQLSEESKRIIAEKARGRKASDETKQKMTEAHLGEKNHFYGKNHSEGSRARMGCRGEEHPFFQKDFTESHRTNISVALRGRIFSENTKQKMSEWQTGRILTESHRENIAKGNLGKKMSPESIAKGVEARKGFKHTEETKKKMSESKIGKLAGGKNSNAKLTDENVFEIKNKLFSVMTDKEIGDKFNVSARIIGRIRSNETWKHIKVT